MKKLYRYLLATAWMLWFILYTKRLSWPIKWKHKPNGNCPVQAEGWFLGYYFYFRSRGTQAAIEFSKTEADWYNYLIHARYVLTTTEEYMAGWLPKWKCRLLIWKGCIKFLLYGRKEKLPNTY